jgi:hypothetical protein
VVGAVVSGGFIPPSGDADDPGGVHAAIAQHDIRGGRRRNWTC